MLKTALRVGLGVGLVAAGYVGGRLAGPEPVVEAAQDDRVYELRTYTAHDGKLANVNARFRDHTVGLFEKAGMTNVAYWNPTEGPLAGNTLIYVVSHNSRDAAKASWDAFRKNPDWVKARTESEANGPIVAKVESVFMKTTDYSPMK